MLVILQYIKHQWLFTLWAQRGVWFMWASYLCFESRWSIWNAPALAVSASLSGLIRVAFKPLMKAIPSSWHSLSNHQLFCWLQESSHRAQQGSIRAPLSLPSGRTDCHHFCLVFGVSFFFYSHTLFCWFNNYLKHHTALNKLILFSQNCMLWPY